MADRAGLLREDHEAGEALTHLVRSAAELVQAAAHGAEKDGSTEEARTTAAFMVALNRVLGAAEVVRDILHGGPPSDN